MTRGSRWPTVLTVGAVLAAVALVVGAFATVQDRTADAKAEAVATTPLPTHTEYHQIWPHVAFIGDSYVGGSAMGGNGEDNFTALMAKHFTWVPFFDGQGGTGYDSGIAHFGSPSRLRELRGQEPFNAVFIINGINDVNGFTGMDDPKVGSLLDAARRTYAEVKRFAPHAQLVVIGYFDPLGSRPIARPLNQRLRQIAEAAGGAFIDPATLFQGPQSSLIGRDHFHPTNKGHRVLAQIMERRLETLPAFHRIEQARRRVTDAQLTAIQKRLGVVG